MTGGGWPPASKVKQLKWRIRKSAHGFGWLPQKLVRASKVIRYTDDLLIWRIQEDHDVSTVPTFSHQKLWCWLKLVLGHPPVVSLFRAYFVNPTIWGYHFRKHPNGMRKKISQHTGSTWDVNPRKGHLWIQDPSRDEWPNPGFEHGEGKGFHCWG